jgi:protein-S-isoprenylcysteine O-methyltransferase Ste14
MQASGQTLFRYRSFALLALVPLLALTIWRGEPLERLIGPDWDDDLFEYGCFALAIAGLLMRAATVGFAPRRTSGRNTTTQVADSLNTTGFYSLTRNPLYFANSLIYMALAAATQDPVFIAAVAFFLVLYYERIVMAEEAFLAERFGAAYRRWADETPPFLPRLHGWRAPAEPFSLRYVLRREPPSWLAAILVFTLIDLAADAVEGDWIDFVHDGDFVPLALALPIYLVLAGIKRYGTALRGRG